jgi:hypothetical protein
MVCLDTDILISGRGHAGHLLEFLGFRHRLWRTLHLRDPGRGWLYRPGAESGKRILQMIKP